MTSLSDLSTLSSELHVSPSAVAVGMINVDGVFRQSLVGIGLAGEEFLLDASDPNLAIEIVRCATHSISHVMVGRYIESLDPPPKAFCVFRLYAEKLHPDSLDYESRATGRQIVSDDLAADGTRYAVSYDRLTVSGLLDDNRLLHLMTGDPPAFRRPARRLTIEHSLYRLDVPWIPHPWFGRDENEETLWIPRSPGPVAKPCIQ